MILRKEKKKKKKKKKRKKSKRNVTLFFDLENQKKIKNQKNR